MKFIIIFGGNANKIKVRQMNTAKTAIMTIAITLAVIVGMTGFAAAMNTNVVYNGDGQYNCNYNAYGTGYIGIHTYTNDGTDRLMSGWSNSEANGWQKMDTHSDTDYSCTIIDRSATVGGADIGEYETGYIVTRTSDKDGNSVMSRANYQDNRGCGSHVTTEQDVVVGTIDDVFGCDITGVAADTNIRGYSYGGDTFVNGLVRTESGNSHTYAYLGMNDGRMDLQSYGAAGSIPEIEIGACGQIVIVDEYTSGDGKFAMGAGIDIHGISIYMHDDLGNIIWYEKGYGTTVGKTTTFDGNFGAIGYVYAVDLP